MTWIGMLVSKRLRREIDSLRKGYADMARLLHWVDEACKEECECGGRGPDDSPCTACTIYHRTAGRFLREKNVTLGDMEQRYARRT